MCYRTLHLALPIAIVLTKYLHLKLNKYKNAKTHKKSKQRKYRKKQSLRVVPIFFWHNKDRRVSKVTKKFFIKETNG